MASLSLLTDRTVTYLFIKTISFAFIINQILIPKVIFISAFGFDDYHLILYYCVTYGTTLDNLANLLKLKIKRNDWLLADTCPQSANRYALFLVGDCAQIL